MAEETELILAEQTEGPDVQGTTRGFPAGKNNREQVIAEREENESTALQVVWEFMSAHP